MKYHAEVVLEKHGVKQTQVFTIEGEENKNRIESLWENNAEIVEKRIREVQ